MRISAPGPNPETAGIDNPPSDEAPAFRPRRLRSPLARKQLFFILLFSSIITLAGTSIQLYIEYRKDMGAIDLQFGRVEHGYLGSLTSSLWKLDDDQLQILLTNMLSMRDVVRLEIYEKDKLTYWVGDMVQNVRHIRRSYDMRHSRNGRSESIGTLHAVATLSGVHQRLGERLVIILSTQAIKTFLVSLFILAIIHFLVTRHLHAMATHVRSLDPSRLGEPMVLPIRTGKKDELDDVAGAINDMEVRLNDHIKEQEKANKNLSESENRLRQSQKLLKTVLSSLDEVVLLVEPQGGLIVDANATASRIFGYARNEIVGRRTDFLHVDEAQFTRFQKESRQSFRKHGFYTTEYQMRRKDGEAFVTEHYVTKISGQQGTPELEVSIIRDISRRKMLETRIQQSQKLEAVGTLTGGIAHDFNNILGIIIGNTELAMSFVDWQHPGRTHLEEIMTASLRAKEVIAQLLSYGRKSDQPLIPIQLTPVVESTVKLLRSSIPPEIEMVHYFEEKLAAVKADAGQIHQVILNLCTNACQAMEPRGGRMTIHLVNTELTQGERHQHINLPAGPYVRLTVSDTGSGIAAEHLAKVFDPYFTTKDVGKGTGLGMAVVHGVVNNHQGAVLLDSAPGRGTRVDVYLPAADRPTQAEQPPAVSKTRDESRPVGNIRILIVDDEPQLVQLGKSMLIKLGYTVETATRPKEAIELIRAAPSRLDVLITDWSMPGMSGIELAGQVHALQPDLPIIMCSGISSRVKMEDAHAAGIHHLLTKPYDLDTLADVLSAALPQGHVKKSP